MTPKCTSWLGHHYQARYSITPPVVPAGGIPYSPAVDELHLILERLATRTYECDVCIRCGHVVERKP